MGDKLETDAPAAKITAKSGNELEGVYFKTDLATAKSIDAFTWKPAGESAYFLRIRHVIRPKSDTSFSVKLSTPANERNKVSAGDLAAVIDQVTAGWHPDSKARVVPLNRTAQLPDGIKQAAKDRGFELSEIHGVLFEGKAYIVRENLQSTAEAREAILHETLGHGGVRGFLGDAYSPMMREIFNMAGGIDGLRNIAEKFGVGPVFETYIPEGKGNRKLRLVTPRSLLQIDATSRA